MSFVIDSNAPYFTEFPLNRARDAVYMMAEDSVLGNVFAVVYRAHEGNPKLSVILIGAHGTSGYVDMTLDRTSRFFGACRGLAPTHYKSLVRRALAIAVLRTYSTMDKPLRERLRGSCDESAAGSLGSRFRLVCGKFPSAIGSRMIDSGFISAKKIDTTIVDVIYEDRDATIDQNNELVHLLGEQLEQLFDPLSEYSPEPTERLYVPPTTEARHSTLDEDPKEVQDLCEEIYLSQAHIRGDILDLLQTVLIPLRIEVLKGNLPGLSIARLNTVFPPTIDELFRVNNIFYEALRSALPFGAFEVMKACGATIPYFYRACMRHEAATQNFTQGLTELLSETPELAKFLEEFSAKLYNIMENPTHLKEIRPLLDNLEKELSHSGISEKERQQLEEFYQVATGTVDAFAGKSGEQRYGDKKLGSAGRVLEECAQGWPIELEYGWLNRRVVTIFDAVDLLEPSDSVRELHVVFILFTDYLVVCRPSEPIPVSSLSGLHIPFVGDMLMHAMLNDAPVDKNLPPLRVIAWAPISEVHFASYARQYLYVFSPGIIGSYKLVQPDSDAQSLVTLLAKAKITMKTQPFHLFKLAGSDLTVYSTVQEVEGYREEQDRTGIAVVLSKEVNDRTLRKYGLNAAISLQILGEDKVQVQIVSRMRYNASFSVRKAELRTLIVSELAYLLTLSLSSQNMAMLDVIITANKLLSSRLIKWASEPSKTAPGHKKTPAVTAKAAKPTAATSKPAAATSKPTAATSKPAAATSKPTTATTAKPTTSKVAPAGNHTLKIPGAIPNKSRDEEPVFVDAPETLQDGPDIDGDVSYSSYSTTASSEEAEQRDVDNWYHQLHTRHDDDESLNSTDLSSMSFTTHSPASSGNSTSIQIGAMLDRSASNLYNQNAGRAFPRIESIDGSHRRQETETSFETLASLQDSEPSSSGDSLVSGNTTVANDNEVEDFSYLATLVDATNFQSKLVDDSTYPDLRDTSLVRLGSYVLYGSQRPSSVSMSSKQASTASKRESREEETPKIGSGNFVAAEPKLANTEDWIVLEQGLLSQTESEDDAKHDTKLTPSAAITPSATTRSATIRSVTAEDKAKPTKFSPFAYVESTEGWKPKAVRSGTNRTLGGTHVYFPDHADFVENSFDEDEDGHRLAEDWLRWSKMTRPLSTISIQTLKQISEEEPSQQPDVPVSQSVASFRRMVLSSSLHTLQLASFTVQIDQKQMSCSQEVSADLDRLKQFVTQIYKMHDITPQIERQIRGRLTGFYELLLKDNCAQLAQGLLEIEWVRRTRIIELGRVPASQLWRYD